jgi:type IV pilus assembly protein PilV
MNTRAYGMIEDSRQQGPQSPMRIPNLSATPCSSKGLHGLRSQAGSMLLESFIAILIFSMGILAIVGMQASAVKNSADAKYRSDANLLANELIGQMWVSDRTNLDLANPPNLLLQTNFQGGAGVDGASYTAWYSNVQATLPGSSSNPPVVNINSATGVVTITVQWIHPSEPAGTTPHNYTIVAQIK